MKSEKGVTLITVTIYIIAMTIILGVIAVLSGAFMKSMQESNFNNEPITEYMRFNTYFSEEVNTPGIKILECTNDYVVFSNGVQYSFIEENRGIYRNKVKICWNIDKCNFVDRTEDEKQMLSVHFVAEGIDYTTDYTLK